MGKYCTKIVQQGEVLFFIRQKQDGASDTNKQGHSFRCTYAAGVHPQGVAGPSPVLGQLARSDRPSKATKMMKMGQSGTIKSLALFDNTDL